MTEETTRSAEESAGEADDTTSAIPAEDWKAGIAADRRAKIQRFNSVDDLAKSYTEAQSKLGGALFPPAADADETAWQKFHAALRPVSPAGYVLPEQARDLKIRNSALKDLAAAAHDAGLSQHQFAALVNRQARSAREADEARRDGSAESWRELAHDWGPELDRRSEIARRARLELGLSDEEVAALGDAMQSQATVVRALYKVGVAIGEGREVVAQGNATLGGSPDDLRKMAREIQNSPRYWRDKDPAAHREVQELWHQVAAREGGRT